MPTLPPTVDEINTLRERHDELRDDVRDLKKDGDVKHLQLVREIADTRLDLKMEVAQTRETLRSSVVAIQTAHANTKWFLTIVIAVVMPLTVFLLTLLFARSPGPVVRVTAAESPAPSSPISPNSSP